MRTRLYAAIFKTKRWSTFSNPRIGIGLGLVRLVAALAVSEVAATVIMVFVFAILAHKARRPQI
jgi:4-hydroxybenzoate polyprenyltransferase